MQSIQVKHNIEVAHRLHLLPGKCENIHGHSMWVTLELFGDANEAGLLAGLDFGTLKRQFRNYLDTVYDHRLLLHRDDPWARAQIDPSVADDNPATLPGLVKCAGDPTTENIARWVGEHFQISMGYNLMESGIATVAVHVQETHVNAATWRSTQ